MDIRVGIELGYMKPSANWKDQLFLHEVVAHNVQSLGESKYAMQEGVVVTDNWKTWLEVDNNWDVMEIVKRLIWGKVFDAVVVLGCSQEGVGWVKKWEDWVKLVNAVLC